MSYSIKEEGNISTVHLDGEIDMDVTEKAKETIFPVIDSGKEVPDMKDILTLPVEGPKSKSSSDKKSFTPDAVKFPTLIH